MADENKWGDRRAAFDDGKKNSLSGPYVNVNDEIHSSTDQVRGMSEKIKQARCISEKFNSGSFPLSAVATTDVADRAKAIEATKLGDESIAEFIKKADVITSWTTLSDVNKSATKDESTTLETDTDIQKGYKRSP